jgi:UDP-sugar transporter A1/2/3
VVWAYVLIQAGGGLLIAAVIKYADNILKASVTQRTLKLLQLG